MEKSDEIPYCNEDGASHVCSQRMAVHGLDKIKWFSNHWELMTLRVKRNAQPVTFVTTNDDLASKKRGSVIPPNAEVENKISTAVFSHGILGNVFFYSYQCMNLA